MDEKNYNLLNKQSEKAVGGNSASRGAFSKFAPILGVFCVSLVLSLVFALIGWEVNGQSLFNTGLLAVVYYEVVK